MTEQRAEYTVPIQHPVPPEGMSATAEEAEAVRASFAHPVRVTRPAPRGTMRDVKRTHLSPAVAAFIAWCAEVVSTEVKQ